MKLLLIDDDEGFGAALRRGLEQLGHQVQWLRRAREFEPSTLNERWDAILLDLSLPDGDGLDLLRRLRQRRDGTPVVVVSARGDRSQRISLLDEGADDYLVKPIDLDELDARLRAVARRGRQDDGSRSALHHGALRMAAAGGPVTWHGRPVVLRERERWLLEQFMQHPEHLFTRAQLEATLAAGASTGESNLVEVYVHHLRRKLHANVVVTVRGLGYRLGPPED